MTHYKNLMSKIEEKTDECKTYYFQEIKLKRYQNVDVQNTYSDIISSISNCMSERFVSLEDSVLSKNLFKYLDTKTWPSEKDSVQFGDTEIAEFISIFLGFLSNGGCRTDEVLSGWLTLKSYMILLIANNKNMKYREI